MMKLSPTRLSYLESLFVREFRTSQRLYELTRQERLALYQDDSLRLFTLIGQKERLLDELTGLENAKFSMVKEMGIAGNGETKTLHVLKLIDLLKTIDAESARRLLRLQEGVLMVMNQVRELTRGNQVLALNALQRANTLQTSLLNAYQFPPRPGRVGARTENKRAKWRAGELHNRPFDAGQLALPAVFAAIINARNVLNADDTRAIAAAIGELQQALESVAHYLDSDEALSKFYSGAPAVAPERVSDPQQPEGRMETSLVEMIANLHHQETAYQASLDVSSRMLAAA